MECNDSKALTADLLELRLQVQRKRREHERKTLEVALVKAELDEVRARATVADLRVDLANFDKRPIIEWADEAHDCPLCGTPND